MMNISWTLDNEGRLTATWMGNPSIKPSGAFSRRPTFLTFLRGVQSRKKGAKLK